MNKEKTEPTQYSQMKSPPTAPIRLQKPTLKLLRSMLTKINKKPYGRKLKFDDLISKSIQLLDEKHLEEIKESSYSSKDKLEIEYKKYCHKNGQISKDLFLEKIMKAAIPQLD